MKIPCPHEYDDVEQVQHLVNMYKTKYHKLVYRGDEECNLWYLLVRSVARFTFMKWFIKLTLEDVYIYVGSPIVQTFFCNN
jgi:hypothetical protein